MITKSHAIESLNASISSLQSHLTFVCVCALYIHGPAWHKLFQFINGRPVARDMSNYFIRKLKCSVINIAFQQPAPYKVCNIYLYDHQHHVDIYICIYLLTSTCSVTRITESNSKFEETNMPSHEWIFGTNFFSPLTVPTVHCQWPIIVKSSNRISVGAQDCTAPT